MKEFFKALFIVCLFPLAVMWIVLKVLFAFTEGLCYSGRKKSRGGGVRSSLIGLHRR